MSAQRTMQFVFEEIGEENSTKCLFVVCTDGSRSLANLDDIAKVKAEGAERVARQVIEARRQAKPCLLSCCNCAEPMAEAARQALQEEKGEK